jgi:myo-inositol-1-phosphate synthase
MPPELRERLAAEASAAGRGVNDVAVEILAARFGIPFEPSGRTGAAPRSTGALLLRMPAELKERLQARARQRRRTTNDLIVETLAERLGATRKGNMSSKNGSSNGRARSDDRADDKVRVAIIGVGNCANSLLQGVEYYKDAPDDQFVPGLMHVNLGGYHVRDVEFVAAFDVVKGKVGKDLAEAIWAPPNDTIKFAEVPKTGVKVSRGMTHDGLGKYLSQIVEKEPGETDDVVGILKERNVDVVVNYLPVGSEMATKWYAEQILEAGCAMVNCMPVFIARESYWQRRFEEKGLPIIGDDIKSQVGATITHRVLTTLFSERGVHLDKTMQLNVGGNSDFLNMLERERLESKKISKTNAVTSMLDYDLGDKNVHVGPSDYVPWLTDRKWAYIRMEGTAFGDVPLNVELKLEVWDSPNSAGIVIDAVRLAKLALNNGIAGSLVGPSSYLMKSPPEQIADDDAAELVEEFIEKNRRRVAQPAPAAASA